MIEFMSGVFATLVGFLFAVLWDLWKDHRRKTSEAQRARRLVLDEIEANISLLKHMTNILTHDSEAAKERQEVVEPLSPVPTEAWRTTRLAGSFSATDDLANEIGQTYHALAVVNHRVQTREMFRATNKAMTNYPSTRTLLNNDLAALITGVLPRLEQHSAALKAAI